MGAPTKQSVLKALKSNALTLATLAGVLIGILLGIGLRSREEEWSKREVMYVKFIGTLFLQMLKAIIIPLIVPSLIVAVGSLDLSLSGKFKKNAKIGTGEIRTHDLLFTRQAL